jgi:acylphosphatase
MYSGASIQIRGLVQGVGFRYFACKAAQSLSLTGSVRNVQDGSVQVQVHGLRPAILAFIEELKLGNRYSRVTSVTVQWITYAPTSKNFTIVD